MDASTILSAYGLPGLIVFVLAGVVVFIYKDNRRLQDDIRSIQDQRLVDAKETRDKLTEPLDRLTKQSELIYDLLLSSGKRGR